MQTLEGSITTGRHPLDPLSAEEMETASATLRGERRLGEGVRFVSIGLKEPSRDVVLAFQPGDPIARQAVVVLREKTRWTMPVTHACFQLKPQGFFDGNPALDVPPTEHCPS
jgi:Cu2+-containing amine oxidase